MNNFEEIKNELSKRNKLVFSNIPKMKGFVCDGLFTKSAMTNEATSALRSNYEEISNENFMFEHELEELEEIQNEEFNKLFKKLA